MNGRRRARFGSVGDPNPRSAPMTKWVASFPTADGMTVHVEGTLADVSEACDAVLEMAPGQEWSLVEMPATWECDGRDGCQVAA